MMGIREFLKTLAPDYCWVTAEDLYLMYEQINEDICPNSFKVSLCNMVKKGYFKMKPWPMGYAHHTNSRRPMLYLRVK